MGYVPFDEDMYSCKLSCMHQCSSNMWQARVHMHACKHNTATSLPKVRISQFDGSAPLCSSVIYANNTAEKMEQKWYANACKLGTHSCRLAQPKYSPKYTS